MDKIFLKKMAFYGYHGCLDFEQQQGQLFYIDLILSVDLTAAGHSDNVDDTIDYAAVFKTIQHIVEGKPFHLIERLATVIANTILAVYSPIAVTVTVHKPSAPIPGFFDDVSVTIERTHHV
jgi:dihydroneopterin aldolase